MSLPAAYAPARSFFALAGVQKSVTKIVVAAIVIEVAWLLTVGLLSPLMDDGRSTLTALATLGSFAGMLGAAILAARMMQNRSAATLFGPIHQAVRDGLACARGLLVFLIVINLLSPGELGALTLNFSPIVWLTLLPISLAFVLLQVTAEEVVYRGFLLQSLGARFASPWVWMGGVSLLFGLGHASAEIAPDAQMAYVIWTTAFGIAAADLTARTGTLGAAIGLHFMTNAMLMVVFSEVGNMSGLALFVYEDTEPDAPVTAISLAVDLVFLWMMWMVCRIAIRR